MARERREDADEPRDHEDEPVVREQVEVVEQVEESDSALDPEPLAAGFEDVVRVFDPERWKEGRDVDDDAEEPPYIRSDAPIPPG
jgi:hypothetical protein